jgi:hypothetical protein
MVQGGASRWERIWGNNKWNENEGKLKRSWSGAATHVPTCHDAEGAISNFALGELAKRGGPEART